MRSKLFFVATGTAVLAAVACATGTVEFAAPDGGEGNEAGSDGATDGNVNADSGCPQYDLTKDPAHCGTCTHACASGEVCSSGQCKAQCDPPTTKCTSADGGVVCSDTKSDTQHCGGCGTACSSADAGSLSPGTNNPDAAIPYDGGSGWNLGAPSCEAGACGTTCTNGTTACTDGICYDTQNFHDRCGDCNTACAANTEWCNAGHCCTTDKLYCGSACVSVLTDNANCGGCGVTCSGGTPYCSKGACIAACVPSGTRRAFNTMSSHTTTGCWTGNPCAQGTYSWVSTNGQSFINANENVVCGGTTACVSHIGITTYEQSANCQGSFDVYCDAAKVGTIDTTGKACNGDAMSNGCSLAFAPLTCSSVKLVGITGSVGACCGSTGLHSLVTGVSAW